MKLTGIFIAVYVISNLGNKTKKKNFRIIFEVMRERQHEITYTARIQCLYNYIPYTRIHIKF